MANEGLGRWGEERAVEFLGAKGYKVLEKNYQNKLGEIDLVVSDGKVICFVEVKARRSLAYGQPFESVTRHKQRKISQVALSYLKRRFGTVDIYARFDVVSIIKGRSGQMNIEHIPNAFDLP